MNQKIKNADKIIVLGGTGHLGSALIHYLNKVLQIDPEKIHAFYLSRTPTDAIDDIPGLKYVPGNILQPDSVEKAMTGADVVFHMVGNTSFDPRKKLIQWLVNVEGTYNVLEAYRKSETIKKMVYTSTVNTLAVPDPLGSIGTIETCDPYSSQFEMHSFENREDALSFGERVRRSESEEWVKEIGIGYFDSKLTAQELVNDYAANFGLNITSVLPGTMFGPYDYLVGNGMYLISLFHNKMPGVLPGGMPFAHVMDVARGHVTALENAKKGSRYIITGERNDNLYLMDMVKIIVEELRLAFPQHKIKLPKRMFKKRIAMIGAALSEMFSRITNKPNPLSRDAVKCGSLPLFYTSNKAESEIGYKPEHTFRTAVRDMIKYYDQYGIFSRDSRYVDRME